MDKHIKILTELLRNNNPYPRHWKWDNDNPENNKELINYLIYRYLKEDYTISNKWINI